MRFRSANISVAASRTTVRRRIVEFSQPGPRRKTIGGAPVITTPRAPKRPRRASSSMMLAVDDRAVKAAPPGGRRAALTALLYLNVPRKALKGRSCDHLTSRSTSVRVRLESTFHHAEEATSLAGLNDSVRLDVPRAAQLAEPSLTAFDNLQDTAPGRPDLHPAMRKYRASGQRFKRGSHPAMLTPFEEMPVHQMPYPFSVPASTDVAL
jgi:hypothetical protein